MRKIKLTVSYDGTNYCGWQIQPNGTSVQSVLQNTLTAILTTPTQIFGAGRTDAGVHATGQVAHFETESKIPKWELEKGLNSLLPDDIRIIGVEEAEPSFHSRFSAKQKTYIYRVCTKPVQCPFERRYVFHYTHQIDKRLIQKAIPFFIGTKDFSAFANESNRGSASIDAVRTLYTIDLVDTDSGFSLLFKGDGFLYKMVRNITGTLLDIGREWTKLEAVEHILRSKMRSMGGPAAPPHGLELQKVEY